MKTLITQGKDKIVNIEQCDSIFIDSGGLSVNIHCGQILIGRYDSEAKRNYVLDKIREFNSGCFAMPQNEELEFLNEVKMKCDNCGAEMPIPLSGQNLKDISYTDHTGTPNAKVYCWKCGKEKKIIR
jgi:hypothetical protein